MLNNSQEIFRGTKRRPKKKELREQQNQKDLGH